MPPVVHENIAVSLSGLELVCQLRLKHQLPKRRPERARAMERSSSEKFLLGIAKELKNEGRIILRGESHRHHFRNTIIEILHWVLSMPTVILWACDMGHRHLMIGYFNIPTPLIAAFSNRRPLAHHVTLCALNYDANLERKFGLHAVLEFNV